jgi:thiamine pyrophosphokinase
MKVIIFANGLIEPQSQFIPDLMPGDLVIAADGGIKNALICGFNPDVVIGDLDSIPACKKGELVAHGTQFITYPRDKDQTDLELALDYAVKIGAEASILIGLLGGRLDQTIANLLLLTKDTYSPMKLSIFAGQDTAHLLRDHDTISIESMTGDIVSLIPLSPLVTGVTTQNLRWPLNSAKLEFGSTLSVSNEMKAPNASIQIKNGKLLVIHRRNENSY